MSWKSATVVIGVIAAVAFLWPNDLNEVQDPHPESSDSLSTGDSELPVGSAGSIDRQEVQSEGVSEPHWVITPQLLASIKACLSEKGNALPCLARVEGLDYDIDLYSELVTALAVESRHHAAVLAASFLTRTDPLEAAALYMALDAKCRSKSGRVDELVMERGIWLALDATDVQWREETLESLHTEVIFDPTQTESGVVLARCLAGRGTQLALNKLREGLADGMGSEMQQARAVASLAVTATNSIDAHLELAAVVENSQPGVESAAVSMAGILALRSQYWPDGDSSAAVQLVDRVLSDSAWGGPLAAQIRADYPKGPPRGMPADQWKTIELALEYWEEH